MDRDKLRHLDAALKMLGGGGDPPALRQQTDMRPTYDRALTEQGWVRQGIEPASGGWLYVSPRTQSRMNVEPGDRVFMQVGGPPAKWKALNVTAKQRLILGSQT